MCWYLVNVLSYGKPTTVECTRSLRSGKCLSLPCQSHKCRLPMPRRKMLARRIYSRVTIVMCSLDSLRMLVCCAPILGAQPDTFPRHTAAQVYTIFSRYGLSLWTSRYYKHCIALNGTVVSRLQERARALAVKLTFRFLCAHPGKHQPYLHSDPGGSWYSNDHKQHENPRTSE